MANVRDPIQYFTQATPLSLHFQSIQEEEQRHAQGKNSLYPDIQQTQDFSFEPGQTQQLMMPDTSMP